MNTIYGDLLDQKGLLVQQVNCMGAMGRGLALAIRQKWPLVYTYYRAHQWELGKVQIVKVADDTWVCNLAGQKDWGTSRVQTNLVAYQIAWPKVHKWAFLHDVQVYVPWRFGCGLAGGDWNVIKPLIEELCPKMIWVIRENGAWEKQENYRGIP